MEPTINSAICKGYFQQVRYLIQQGYNVNARDPTDGRTPLIHCAIVDDERWSVGMARNLIENGALIRLRDFEGRNAFHYACIFRRLKLVSVYLSGIDFDIGQGDKLGNTALHYAVAVNDAALTKVVADGHCRYKVPLDGANVKGVTPLLEAYRNQSPECVKVLINAGADDRASDVVVHPTEGRTILGPTVAMVTTPPSGNENQTPKGHRASISESRRISGSAPLLLKRRRPLSALPAQNHTGHRTGHQTSHQNDASAGTIAKDISRLTGKFHRDAGTSDPHNRPDWILGVSPLQYFSEHNRDNSRPHTVDADACRPSFSLGWRVDLKRLYTTFDFQFTSSYRTSAKPKPGAELDEDGRMMQLLQVRGPSPNPSDSFSDNASVMSRKTRKHSFLKSGMDVRKANKAVSGFQTQGGRRGSNVSPPDSIGSCRKKSSITEVAPDALRASHAEGEDGKGKVKAKAGSSKAGAKNRSTSGTEPSVEQQPTRPPSRTGHYQGGSTTDEHGETTLSSIQEV